MAWDLDLEMWEKFNGDVSVWEHKVGPRRNGSAMVRSDIVRCLHRLNTTLAEQIVCELDRGTEPLIVLKAHYDELLNAAGDEHQARLAKEHVTSPGPALVPQGLRAPGANGTGQPLAVPLTRKPLSICLADVEPEDVSWLWRGRVPLGKVTIIDGDPDLGKSTVTIDLAARVTTGSLMPDGSTSDLEGPADVILISIEDGPGDTIRPRADAAGADVHRMHLLTDIEVLDDQGIPKTVSWVMPRDLDMLRELIRSTNAKLVILDPLVGVVEGKVSLNNDQDTRTALRPLAQMADELGFAVIALRHLNKSGGQNAKLRGGGSIAIIGAARSGLLVGLDPEDETEETKVIATTKHNLSKSVPSLSYRLASSPDNPSVACVEWLGESSLTAGALLAEPQTDDQRSERDEIADIIHQLTEGGPCAHRDAVNQIRSAGYLPSDSTIRRAIGLAGCETTPAKGFGGKRAIQRVGGNPPVPSTPTVSP